MDVQTCTKCSVEKPISEYYFVKGRGKHQTGCKNCQADYTKSRWPGFKERCAEYKGGCCVVCGYDKYLGALDFHHIDPSQKDFSISKRVSMKWDNVVLELDKCVLLCSNCHREAHAGMLGEFDSLI